MTTTKTAMLYDQALAIAGHMVDFLQPRCQRIEIAGSLRREKPVVGDIEIVAIPRPALDMFAQPIPMERDHALNYVDWGEVGDLGKNGNKFKQVQLHDGISLDLFIVTPPAQWGVIFLIRTGPAEYGHRIVTPRQQGGSLPSNMLFEGGAIWCNGHKYETPEETDVYHLIGLPWVHPRERR